MKQNNEEIQTQGIAAARWPWYLALFALVGGIAVLIWQLPSVRTAAGQIIAWVGNPEAIEAFVVWLGWFGPPALISLHALQIIFAPLPAYALFGAAGFLYGTLWGGIYATVGTLLGATAAMLLTRRFGRPLAARMVGEDRMARWHDKTLNQSWFTWGFLLLAPVGDLPFFLAGLAGIQVWRILLLTLVIRVPSIFLIAAAASGTTALSWREVIPIMAVVIVLCAVLFRYQAALLRWFDRAAQQRFVARTESKSP